MEKILVSACLLGNKVRYNGSDLSCDNDLLNTWRQEGRVVALCPEVSAGLPTPRAPAEIQHGTGKEVLSLQATVIDIEGCDVTQPFINGAEIALKLCQAKNIRVAILTEASPSCGSKNIYNGEFSNTKINGFGVTTALLVKNGISVFSQHNIREAQMLLNQIDNQNK